MAIKTHISQQRIQTAAQQPQQSIISRMFSWLQLRLINIFGWLFPAREQLPPSQTVMQTSRGRIYANEGSAVRTRNIGPVITNTNIGEGEIRSRNTTLPLPTLPPGVSDIYMNRGMALEAEYIESLNTTTNIGRQTNDRRNH
ncbi:hypothetical protein HA402_005448 [Bradysia odoriphaga]|nr:hypothetical protein HA402_005448 [Bradysia odoriphaga]